MAFTGFCHPAPVSTLLPLQEALPISPRYSTCLPHLVQSRSRSFLPSAFTIVCAGGNDPSYRSAEGLDGDRGDFTDFDSWNVEAFASLRAHVQRSVAQGTAEPSPLMTPSMVAENLLHAFEKSALEGAKTVLLFSSEQNEFRGKLPHILTQILQEQQEMMPLLNLAVFEVEGEQSGFSHESDKVVRANRTLSDLPVKSSDKNCAVVFVKVWATRNVVSRFIIGLSLNALSQWMIDFIRPCE